MKSATDWQIYRTRFLIRAKQLTQPLCFVDPLGREHRGQKGDYLVESSDGLRRIAPRAIFEDVYVAMGPAEAGPPMFSMRKTRQPNLNPQLSHRTTFVGRAPSPA